MLTGHGFPYSWIVSSLDGRLDIFWLTGSCKRFKAGSLSAWCRSVQIKRRSGESRRNFLSLSLDTFPVYRSIIRDSGNRDWNSYRRSHYPSPMKGNGWSRYQGSAFKKGFVKRLPEIKFMHFPFSFQRFVIHGSNNNSLISCKLTPSTIKRIL